MINIAAEILEKASEGDIAAFEEIYKAAGSFVYNVALKITRNSAQAEEVDNVKNKMKELIRRR